MYVSTLGLRSDQQTRECAAKFDVKAAFASLSAFSFPEMPTCEGTHAMTRTYLQYANDVDPDPALANRANSTFVPLSFGMSPC